MPIGGAQSGLTIMVNSASSVVEKMADYEVLEMLLKEIGKMAATATGLSSTVFPETVFWFCFAVFTYTILKKFGGKAENSEGSLDSLLIEKTAELPMHAESFRLEVEMPGKHYRVRAWGVRPGTYRTTETGR